MKRYEFVFNPFEGEKLNFEEGIMIFMADKKYVDMITNIQRLDNNFVYYIIIVLYEDIQE